MTQGKRAIFSLILLTGCAQPEQCPVPKDYTRQEQIQIAEEHNQLPPGSMLRAVLEDWERMRRELR